jgi:formate C-acetyltransferase
MGTTSNQCVMPPHYASPSSPEQYRSLIVRVAGYSDYFCDLSKTLQDEIIARTEHEAF